MVKYWDIKPPPRQSLPEYWAWKNHWRAMMVSGLSITRKIPVTEWQAPTTTHDWAHRYRYKELGGYYDVDESGL